MKCFLGAQSRGRRGWLARAFGWCIVLAIVQRPGSSVAEPLPGACPTRAPVRVTMQALHQSGGLPLGWRFTPPQGDVAAGRKLFVDYGCHSCHSIQGETFPVVAADEARPGPDLSGMGDHHPAEYFAESILNPDAVLVEGPGYISEGGRSSMPSYAEMTLKQLADLVAYLKSLTLPGAAPAIDCTKGRAAVGSGRAAGAVSPFGYVAQAFEVDDGRLDGFYAWFDRRGFSRYDGLVSIDTYVSRVHRGRHEIVCLFGFDSETALLRFSDEIKKAKPAPDDFVHPTRNYRLQSPPLYLAPQMSVP
ncbi:MAG: cytochrome c [Deltaproteobacteria bacterium]|nr:cytochrome c [Deltaproteobacteria bacterium]